MTNFAVIHNGIVSNVIVCDTKEMAETLTNAVCVEYTDDNPAAIGWTYDETTGKFSAPVVEAPTV